MDEVEEIKRRIDIIELISSYLTLKKAGANYKALCPFHQEKTPSFMVSPEKQIFKCFGCNLGGDVFNFVMQMENLEFREALEMLAQRAGVQLKRRTFRPEEGKDRKTKLYQINDWSAKVFQKILLSHPVAKPALEYLKKRGITLETLKDFMIGYAPQAKVLSGFLAKKGFTASEIQAAGSPDRFFRRIIFPIKDSMGNTIAFTGRVLDVSQEPKYLNTPDTIIFHKGRILYNLNLARGPIKQQKATVVVEGQMDVVASHQANVKNVVATSGTALTEDHLQILYRYSPNIIFAFDSDSAGTATAKKAYQMAIAEGFNVRMVDLASPAGEFKDPGEMIAQNLPAGEAGPVLWQKAIAEAKPVIDWYFQLAFGKQQTADGKELTSQEKKEIAKEILPIIKIIPDTIEQAHYVNLLAKRLEIQEEVVFDALGKIREAPSKTPPQVAKTPMTSEALLLGILLYKPAKLKEVSPKVSFQDFKDPLLKAIYSQLLKEYNKGAENAEKDVLARLAKKVSRETKLRIDSLVLEVENLYRDDESNLEEDLKQALNHLKIDKKEALKSYYASQIQKAENTRDYGKLKKLIKEFQDAIS